MAMRILAIVAGFVVVIVVLAVVIVPFVKDGLPSPTPAKPSKRDVVIELKREDCTIDREQVKRVIVGDDVDIIEWKITNKCGQERDVELIDFTFMGFLPPSPDPTIDPSVPPCKGASGTTTQLCPLEGEQKQPTDTCRAKQKVKAKQSAGQDKHARVARGVNTLAEDRACYKYTIKVGTDTFDPEFVIWR